MAAHVSRQPPPSPRKSYPSRVSSLRASLHDDDLQPCPKPAFVPAPTPLSALDLSDPSLCLTPEKSSVRKPLNTNTNANRSLDSSRGSQKVRFDSTVEIKTMSPHETSNETSKNTSSTLTDLSDDTMELIAQANDYVSPYLNTSAVSSSSSDNSKLSADSKGSNVTQTSCESEDMDYVRVTADDVHTDERHIYGKKLAQHRRSCAVRTSMWGEDGMGDNVLAKPEFNSTLTLKKQLDGIKAEELDIEDEVEQKLAASEALRNKLNEKAALKVNHPWGYGDLVSVEVREEDIISRAERERSSKTKITKLRMPDITPPDIMDCFTPDLQKESLCLSLDIPTPDLKPQPADPGYAFDVYRHIRAWEGW